jgi:polysaccharide export outer membrane protein
LAKAGGLLDGRADPGAVFLYRREPREVAKLLGVDVTRFQGDLIPIVFQVSFRDPSGYFLATRLQMRNQDIIFIANAAQIEVSKVLDFIGQATAAASSTTTAVTGVPTAAAAVKGRTLATPVFNAATGTFLFP